MALLRAGLSRDINSGVRGKGREQKNAVPSEWAHPGNSISHHASVEQKLLSNIVANFKEIEDKHILNIWVFVSSNVTKVSMTTVARTTVTV